MPRQRRGAAPTPARSAPTRPTAAPAQPAHAPYGQQHSQPHSTAAHPPAAPQQAPPAPAPVQQSSGPGLFGQMASTAAGVAVGSSIGHAIGGFFSGGGSSAPAETQQAPPAQSQGMDSGLWQSNAANSSWENPACEADVRSFRKCMDENQGNMSICGWYLDQLKACQAAAKQY
ncbi:hypothetical protein P175DRAFT_0556877 [Aspergillus ochraceoroseus IBT 24754]|uniref:CHCH domain-containing protein n=1 Tax=Aspergillus ochraceoroseus IBT 24754 TaxID=1392256 RepID=A0A2T5M066_9EURO|nr:uncharacterized protein P175DRAFT_0556877 [Aspergillus ochraceoroseus IBT 24754]PTU21927.1 hypothetical protein P175DRAFT_0556877 [Aspergillus ochraceoroseus IBT 24754]